MNITSNKKWYQSKGVWGGVMSALAPAVAYFGYDIGDPQVLAPAIVSFIGGVLAIIGRIKAVERIEK